MDRQYVKINNLKQPDGVFDYKGIPLTSIVPGSQYYPDTANECFLAVDDELPESEDITVLTEAEYQQAIDAYEATKPQPVDVAAQIAELQQQNAQMLLALVTNDLI